MSYPVIERREDDGSGTPGRILSVVFPAILFLLGLALFTVAFNVGDWGPWVFAGGILVHHARVRHPDDDPAGPRGPLTVSRGSGATSGAAERSAPARLDGSGGVPARAPLRGPRRSTSRSGVTTGGPPIS